jgi:hypothetical protein
MAYCTYIDVQSDFKDITLSTTSSITIAEVSQFINEASALIDAKVSLKYVTPITGTYSLLLMKYIARNLVANRIKRILNVKTGDEKLNQKAEETDDISLMQKLQDILDLKLRLSDATLLNAADGIRSYTYSNGFDPHFQRDVDQW